MTKDWGARGGPSSGDWDKNERIIQVIEFQTAGQGFYNGQSTVRLQFGECEWKGNENNAHLSLLR